MQASNELPVVIFLVSAKPGRIGNRVFPKETSLMAD
jgi:hypothetical protein